MAISIFMEMESSEGKVEGGCTIEKREGWMECLEMRHKLYQPIDKTTGNIMGTRVHEPFEVTKMTDKATPTLYKHVCQGITVTSIKFHFYAISPEKNAEEEYYTIELHNARVISVEPALYNSRLPEFEKLPHLEKVTFGYEEIVWKELKDNNEHMDNFRSGRA
jgi:type VI secretion system secreted protein Hcp